MGVAGAGELRWDLHGPGLRQRLLLQRPAGLLEEDVVEGRGVQLDVGDPDPGLIDGPHDVGQGFRPLAELDGDPLRRGHPLAEAREYAGEGVGLRGVLRGHLGSRPPDLRLELGRGALSHNLAVVDDHHAVGQTWPRPRTEW